jgi:hypothetical protein
VEGREGETNMDFTITGDEIGIYICDDFAEQPTSHNVIVGKIIGVVSCVGDSFCDERAGGDDDPGDDLGWVERCHVAGGGGVGGVHDDEKRGERNEIRERKHC